jgi:hypothetical protein
MVRFLRAALLAVYLLDAAVPGLAQGGSGAFRYAALSWERADQNSREVIFTLRSSWRKNSEVFQPELTDETDLSLPVTLLGPKTPTFKVGDGETEHINLQLTIDQYDKSNSDFSSGGGWVSGYTIIRHTYLGDGPFTAEFSGCCRADSFDVEDFEVTAVVDLSTSSFSPALAVLPAVYTRPGGEFSVPTMHPEGLIGPTLLDGSLAAPTFRKATGLPQKTQDLDITVHPQLGTVHVGQSVPTGSYLFGVEVGLGGSNTHSGTQFLLYVKAGAAPPMLRPAVASESNRGSTGDVLYARRTGFTVSVFFDIVSATGSADDTYAIETAGTNLTKYGMTARVVYGATGRTPAAFELRWDKPCLGDAMHLALCFSAVRFSDNLPTGDKTAPGCIEVFVLEDEAPTFVTPQQDEVYTWMMGREYSFDILVRDPASTDLVSALRLARNTTMPAGAKLAPAAFTGNEGQTKFTWMPNPWSGGGEYQLCFTASDTPGSTYEQCRLGERSSSLCVTIVVPRCRYVVRARESLADVAAAFNTDWVQLWSLNPEITQPDLEIGFRPREQIEADPSKAHGAIINSGHLYRVDGGEYVSAIAYKFGITAKQLLFLNADVAAEGGEQSPLHVGQMLCVIPNSCLRD